MKGYDDVFSRSVIVARTHRAAAAASCHSSIRPMFVRAVRCGAVRRCAQPTRQGGSKLASSRTFRGGSRYRLLAVHCAARCESSRSGCTAVYSGRPPSDRQRPPPLRPSPLPRRVHRIHASKTVGVGGWGRRGVAGGGWRVAALFRCWPCVQDRLLPLLPFGPSLVDFILLINVIENYSIVDEFVIHPACSPTSIKRAFQT